MNMRMIKLNEILTVSAAMLKSAQEEIGNVRDNGGAVSDSAPNPDSSSPTES
jgi:hypothetical protein